MTRTKEKSRLDSSLLFGLHNVKHVPGPFIRWSKLKPHFFSVYRMEEAYALRPEGNITVIVKKAVFPVPHQRETVVRKLAAYLMGTACDKVYSDKAETIFLSKSIKLKLRPLYTFCGSIGYIAFALGLVPQHKIIEKALFFCTSMYYGQIFLVKAAFPYLTRQLRCGALRPGQQHKAADHPVQPVHRAYIGLFVTQLSTHKRRHSAGVIGGEDFRRLHRDYYALIHVLNLHDFLRG